MISQIQTKINNGLSTLLTKKPLTQKQVQGVFDRLSYLAYNFTANSLSIRELKELYSFVDDDLPKEILPSALYKNQVLPTLFHETPNLSEALDLLPLSSEQIKIGQQVLENAQIAGFLTQTETLLFFSSSELQDYFCCLYLQAQELNGELLKKIVIKHDRFQRALRIWAELDPNFIEKLKGSFDSETQRIYYIFAMVGTPNACKPMLQTIKDKTRTKSLRSFVFWLFKHYVKEVGLETVTTFIELIKDTEEDEKIREDAVYAIMQYGDIGYPHSVEAYQTDDAQTRLFSVRSLWEVSPQLALPFLITVLKDNVEKIRIAALADILNYIEQGRIECTNLDPYLDYLLDLYLKGEGRFKVMVAEILAWYGDKPALLFICDSILEETDIVYCDEMLQILSQIREPEVILTLQKLLYKSMHKTLAADTVKILKEFQAKEAIPDLLKLVKEGYATVSDDRDENDEIFLSEAAEALISLHSPDLLNISLPLYYAGDLDRNGKIDLINSLIEFAHPEAFTICNELFFDKSDSVCMTAAQGLAKLKSAEILPIFSDMLKNISLTFEQKRAIIWALSVSKDQRAEDILLPILENSDISLWPTTILSLGNLKSRKALPKLEWLKWNELRVAIGKTEIRLYAARAIDAIQQNN